MKRLSFILSISSLACSSLLFINTPAVATTTPKVKQLIPPENFDHPEIKLPSDEEADIANKGYPGSSAFKKCLEAANTNWKEIEIETESWQKAWFAFQEDSAVKVKLQKIQNKSNYIASSGQAQTLSSVQQSIKDELQGIYEQAIKQANKLYKCRAVWAVTAPKSSVDWSKQSHISKGSAQSYDGRIQCATEGPETQDFPACSSMAIKAAVFKVGEKVVSMAQGVDIQNTSFKGQQDLAQEKNYLKGGLMLQKKMLKKRAQQEEQRAVVSSAKFAVFLHAYNTLPDREDLVNRCNSRLKPLGDTDHIKAKLEEYQTAIKKYARDIKYVATSSQEESEQSEQSEQSGQSAPKKLFDKQNSPLSFNNNKLENTDTTCEDVVYNDAFHFIINDGSKQVAKQLMVEAGIDVSKNLIASAMLNKQAGYINKALTEIDEFKPVDLAPLPQQDLTVAQCTANPNAPGCNNLGGNRQFGFSGGTVNLGGNGQNTVGGEIAGEDSNLNASNNNDLPVGDSGAPTGSGSFSGDADKSNNFISDPNNATSSTSPEGPPDNSASGSASGGKDLGSGVQGGGGGGGGGGGPTAPGSVKGKYSGGFTSPKFSGGKNRPSKNNRKKGNPFDGLFGKKKKGKGNKTVNFRGIASNPRGKTIFGQISLSYARVHKDKRLLRVSQ